MTSSARITASLFASVSLLAPAVSSAEPMHTPLHEVLASSPTIAIAKLTKSAPPEALGPFEFEVERVIRGDIERGKHAFGPGGGRVDVRLGQRVVIFISERDEVQFVAEPPVGAKLEGAALMMRGFYDFNAHLVTPSVLTLAQIEALIAGKSLHYKVEGPIQVIDPKRGVVDSGRELSITCEYVVSPKLTGCKKLEVRGLGEPVGLPADPKFGPSAWDKGTFNLSWRTSWPRPLSLEGKGYAIRQSDGAYLAKFHVVMPDILTKEQLDNYLTDPKHSHPVWRYQLALADGRNFSIREGFDYGTGLELETSSGAVHSYSSMSWDDTRTIVFKGDAYELSFAPAKQHASLSRRGTTRQLRQEALSGPLACTLKQRGKAPVKCTLTLVETSFDPAIRAR